MTTYITADTHFSHNNIIQYEQRPFSGRHEMNERFRKETII